MSDQVQEQAPEAATKVEVKPAKVSHKSGNLIMDVAAEVEGLTKQKAINLADKLSEDIDTNSFRLGGVLVLIHQQSWFEGYETFGKFVEDKFGFAERKAQYLMRIYKHLVEKQIPWETVAGIGWTKLKELAAVEPPILTAENAAEWAEKASKLSVPELIAAIKAAKGQTDGSGGGNQSTTSDVVKMTFKLKADQSETVNGALAKAKAEFGTDFDNVALESICAGYLAGTIGGAAPAGGITAEAFAAAGAESVLAIFEQAFPNVNLEVTM